MRTHGLSILTALAVTVLSSASVPAQKPETFDQARAVSTQSQRPILLEFFRDG